MSELIRYRIRKQRTGGPQEEVIVDAPPNSVIIFGPQSEISAIPFADLATDIGIVTADTLANLRAIPSSEANKVAFLLGVTAKYDSGPAKTYVWDAAATDADNPLAQILPDDKTVAEPGRWIMVQ